MKVTVRNLGVIRDEATIDLKPLTIFIGPNNAGKTWLAYTLSGILGSYGSEAYVQVYAEQQEASIYKQLHSAIEGVLAEGNATIDLCQFANDYGEVYFNNVATHARSWMNRFLSTQLAHFDDMSVSVSLTETKTQFLDQISRYSRRSNIAIGPKGSLLTIQKKRGEDKVYVYTSSEVQDTEEQEEQISAKIPPDVVRERLIRFVFTALTRSLYPQIRVFPTERTTLVTFRFGERIARPQFNEKVMEALEVLTEELDTRALIESNSAIREVIRPVSSFMSMLKSTFESGINKREAREKNAKSDARVRTYIQLAEVLEKQILAGNIDFSTPEPEPRREVLFQPTPDVNLEIPIASSMVKELSPLVLYLRHLAQPGELLIIDEPEMNLHPAAQVKIIEFLAMLVNAGLHVLVTTHSTYVVDHLMNLMDAYKHENKEEIVEKFLLERKDAFIAQEKVSVYLVDEGKVENVLDAEGTIHWETFSEVTRLVERIHFEL